MGVRLTVGKQSRYFAVRAGPCFRTTQKYRSGIPHIGIFESIFLNLPQITRFAQQPHLHLNGVIARSDKIESNMHNRDTEDTPKSLNSGNNVRSDSPGEKSDDVDGPRSMCAFISSPAVK